MVYWIHKKPVKIMCLEYPMYRKRDKGQLTMDEFYLPFGDGPGANNRWVKIAGIILWDFIEEGYARNFSEESGRPSIPSRVAFGALFIS